MERRSVAIPDDVEVAIEGRKVSVKGEKGELVRDFSHASVNIRREGKEVIVEAIWPRKKEKAMIGTICAHIKNMITGVRRGFTYKLKVVFSHFPISIRVEGKEVLIENFGGGRRARKAKVVGNARVIVRGDDILVQGIDVEEVSQTASNIEQATKIKQKDPRVFLDGIYVYEKKEGMEG